MGQLKRLRTYNYSKVLLIYSVMFFLFFTFFAYLQHLNLKTSLFDLGLQEHVIRQTSNGNLFKSGVETANYLGDHFSIIILPIALIYKLLPSTLTLLAIQTLAVTSTMLAIYKIALHYTKSSIFSFTLSFIFSTYLGISGLLLFDLHIEVLALPFLAWGIYFMLKKRHPVSMLCLVLAMLCKEDIGIFVGMLGIYNLLIKNFRFGLLLILLGFPYSALVILKIMPSIRGENLDTLLRYSYLGNSGSEIVKNAITKPNLIINELISLYKFKYLLKLSLPVCSLFLLSPLITLTLLPSLFFNLLANYPAQTSALYQYDMVNSIVIFWASSAGFVVFKKQLKKFNYGKIINYAFWFFLILINLIFVIRHPLIGRIITFENRHVDYISLVSGKALIEKDKVISVSNTIGGHFAEYEVVQLFDPPWINYKTSPEYYIIDKQFCCQPENQQLLNENLESRILESIFEENDILIYKVVK